MKTQLYVNKDNTSAFYQHERITTKMDGTQTSVIIGWSIDNSWIYSDKEDAKARWVQKNPDFEFPTLEEIQDVIKSKDEFDELEEKVGKKD